MSMTGDRAVAILGGLLNRQVGFTADEIEELLRAGLVIEVDPDHVTTIDWLAPAVREHAGVDLTDPMAPANLMQTITDHDAKLTSDWYRFTTGDDKLAARTTARRQARRALSYVRDPSAMAPLLEVLDKMKLLQPGTSLVADPALGVELYGMTAKGADVRTQLAVRRDRYGAVPLAAFLKNYDKADAKMRAFGQDIASLGSQIGHVRKNPHQVVIGLAKTGLPPRDAIATYRQAAQRANGAADVAVTLARNAQQFGGTDKAATRLRRAQELLKRAGYHLTPVVLGVAKTVLPFEPLETGVARFRELCSLLSTVIGAGGDPMLKAAGRLMAAKGTPAEVIQRVQHAIGGLHAQPSAVYREAPTLGAGVALAAMVDRVEEVAPLVTRYRQVEAELVRRGISAPGVADDDALECVACPGTPVEVADTVANLLRRVAAGRAPGRADVAVAVAFAKRFAI